MARKQVDPERRFEIGRQRRLRTRAKIIAAAFEIFGDENGLFANIYDIAVAAGVTRATFYNHFAGILEVREALVHEVTHDFLASVTATVLQLPDPRERASVAVRYYLRRARTDRRWGWSMMNMSASGTIFGAETFRQAELTVREGMEAGAFPILSAELGRDILMGTSLAAMGSLVREDMPDDYPEAVVGYILYALGVPHDDAKRIAQIPLPALIAPVPPSSEPA